MILVFDVYVIFQQVQIYRFRKQIAVREELASTGDHAYETTAYAFELVDSVSDVRRSFHLHDPDWFARRFQVVVHEHCEHPIGRADCAHFEGHPVRDAFRGVMLLVEAWMGGATDCRGLRCLDGA